MDNRTWRYLTETDEFLSQAKHEIQSIKDELADGALVLNPSPKILREYLFNVGKIEGLKYLVEYIERIDNDQEPAEGETLFGEDDS